MSTIEQMINSSIPNDRGVEVRDLIAHLQTLDPLARLVYTTDGYTDTPVCTKDFVRQASGAVEVILPKPLTEEIEKSYKDEIESLENEVDELELQVKRQVNKLSKLESALASIRRSVDEAVGS